MMIHASIVIVGIAALASTAASAQQSQDVHVLRDPWVPDAVAARAAADHAKRAPVQSLPDQVERKLRTSFERADVEARGSITRDQARAAGLGLVVREFDRIDVQRTGRVAFDDLLRHLHARGAAPSLLRAPAVK